MPASFQSSSHARRDNGEGTVYQLTTGPRAGSWRAQISLLGGKRKTFSGRTEEEVKQKLLDARWSASHGMLSPSRGESFEQYSLNWLTLRRYELAPRTLAVYRQQLRDQVFPLIGKLAPVDIRREHIKAVHIAMLDKGYKAKTVLLVHGIIGACLAQAEADGLIPSNPVRHTKPPKAQKASFSPLEPDEIKTLIAAMRGDPLEALFLITLTCGLRRGEACGIRWQDLNLQRGTLRLRGQVTRQAVPGQKKTVLGFAPLKTETGLGLQIDLAPPVITALLAHKDRQAFLKTQARELWQENDYVFTNPLGKPIDPMQAYRMFKALLKRAGLRDQRFHDLRHAAASLLLSWGLELWQVSKLLRHSNLGITSDVYAHLYQQTGRELADKMGAFVEGAR